MSNPETRGAGRAPLPKTRVNAFFHHLGRTGPRTVAAADEYRDAEDEFDKED